MIEILTQFFKTKKKYLLQAEALKIALEAKNMAANIYVGIRYWYPFTEEAIQQVSFSLMHLIFLLIVKKTK